MELTRTETTALNDTTKPAATEAGPTPGSPIYRRALIPLDGSLTAEAIIPYFVKIARPLGLEILLLRVMMRVPPQVIEGSRQVVDHTDRLCQEAEQYLLERADVLCAAGMHVQTMVRVGDPITEIVEAAREAGADLIAMTTHGRSGLGRLLFGSVAEAVLRRAHVPVFLLRVSEPQTAMRAA